MLKRKRLITIFGIATLALALLVGFIRQQYVVPIIMYHSVNPDARPENRLAVSVKSFERHMQFLAKHNYNVVSLEALPDLIRSKKRIPHKTIAITFDDGYKDIYTYAFPILKKYNLPATLFIIINEIGRPQDDRVSWEEIMLMQESGIVTFGSHCLGPEPLINLSSPKQVKKEIFKSKEILERRLGVRVDTFSYPEGRFNETIKELVKDAGYKVAVATNPGKSFSNDDIFALKRLRISATSDNLFVFWVETSGYYNFMRENRHK